MQNDYSKQRFSPQNLIPVNPKSVSNEDQRAPVLEEVHIRVAVNRAGSSRVSEPASSTLRHGRPCVSQTCWWGKIETRVRFPSPAPTSIQPNRINGFKHFSIFQNVKVRIKVRIRAFVFSPFQRQKHLFSMIFAELKI
jgi:hypothetical protein